MQVTLGGNRLGSGNKNTMHLHNYYRSTHNLSKKVTTSLAPGVLYPIYQQIGINGDSFDIDLGAIFRTIPTRGPLFGSFKVQLDFFAAPLRLYQGLLHNNPMDVAMQASQIKLPQIEISGVGQSAIKYLNTSFEHQYIAPNALLKYLGISGIANNTTEREESVHRSFFAGGVLAYYDIFKNYYANKQEDIAYVISPEGNYNEANTDLKSGSYNNTLISYDSGDMRWRFVSSQFSTTPVLINGNFLNTNNLLLDIYANSDTIASGTLAEMEKLGYIIISKNEPEEIIIYFDYRTQVLTTKTEFEITQIDDETAMSYNKTPQLVPFELKNIDRMRYDILAQNELGETFYIDSGARMPYKTLCLETGTLGISYNAFAMNGLVVKTYQSDIFNNWVQTDWITGENGILAVTSIDTSSGSFNLDTLNLASKVYNMLCRIAVTDGTYQGWQEAVWAEQVQRHAETPIYLGGMSSEIMFEEVISTAETTNDGETQALGTLGGRGKELKQKGGHLTFKIHEPSIIMGILSLTPRLTYSQGNKWFNTELKSIDDLHKPALDGIGFQNLITEQMAWWDTTTTNGGDTLNIHSAGKVPAWVNYMTDYDECYGDFAAEQGKAFMVLNRNYERNEYGRIKDLTTYIDPAKFNYAFAYSELTAQNFWAQIGIKCIARRKMSAKIIPNL